MAVLFLGMRSWPTVRALHGASRLGVRAAHKKPTSPRTRGGGDLAELIAGGLGGLVVVGGSLLGGGVAGERAESGQRLGRGGAVQVPVGDDRAVGAAQPGRGIRQNG